MKPQSAIRAPRSALLLISPTWLVLGLLFLVPLAIMLWLSSQRAGLYGTIEPGPTLANYFRCIEPGYVAIYGRSVWIAVATTVICLLVSYPVAYYIGRASEKSRNLLIMLVMIPFWTSFLIRTYAWLTILKSEGLLNSLLLQMGVISVPFDMLYTPGAVILGLVYTFLPFMILPIYTSVEKLDNALVEAAFDLGAAPGRAFSKVIVPMTWPGITAGVLLVFVPALGLYAVNDVLGGGKVDMIGNIIENQFKGTARNWPFGAALGMTLIVAFSSALWYTSRRQHRSA